MKTTIEARKFGTCDCLIIDIGPDQWGDNVVFTKTDSGLKSTGPTQISFSLNAETARALSFAFGELAKTLGKQK